jgi:hypothetical protein
MTLRSKSLGKAAPVTAGGRDALALAEEAPTVTSSSVCGTVNCGVDVEIEVLIFPFVQAHLLSNFFFHFRLF